MLFLGILSSTMLHGCKQEAAKNDFNKTVATQFIDTLAVQDSAMVSVPQVVILQDNVVDRMIGRAQLSDFVAALNNTALDSILKTEEGPFTIFAVLNTQEIKAENTYAHIRENPDWPASYVVKGAYSTPDIYKSFSSLRPQTSFKTLDQKQVVIYDVRDSLFFEFYPEGTKAYLYSSDLFASNGVVHIIKYMAD